jgi:hypothetical protein
VPHIGRGRIIWDDRAEPRHAPATGRRGRGKQLEPFVYDSIVSPKAYVAQGFPRNVMPRDFAETLTKEQLAELVAFITANVGAASEACRASLAELAAREPSAAAHAGLASRSAELLIDPGPSPHRPDRMTETPASQNSLSSSAASKLPGTGRAPWGVPPRREGKESSGLERSLNSCPSTPSVSLQAGRFIEGRDRSRTVGLQLVIKPGDTSELQKQGNSPSTGGFL